MSLFLCHKAWYEKHIGGQNVLEEVYLLRSVAFEMPADGAEAA